MARKLPDLSALGQPRPGEPRRSLLGLDEEDGGDALLGLIQDWSIDGDGITDLCKRVSTWCLAAGRGSSMCADPNDVQWLNLCWRVGWPKPTTPQTRPAPPTVEGEQLTWKQTFYALCKALNTERGTFPDAKGEPNGRNWYLRMVAEQQKPRADQRPRLLERALFEWSLNPGRLVGGRDVPPPVMRACARAWYAAHPAWVLDPVDVNAKRALYEELDRRLVQHVLRGEIEPLRAVVERGADIDVGFEAPLLRTIEACLQFNPGQFPVDDDDEDVPFLETDTAFAVLEELLALGASVTGSQNVLTFAMRIASEQIDAVATLGTGAFPTEQQVQQWLQQRVQRRARMLPLLERVVGRILDRPDYRSPIEEPQLLSAALKLGSVEAVRRLLAHPGVTVAPDDLALSSGLYLPSDPLIDEDVKTEILKLLVRDGRIDPTVQPRRNLPRPFPPPLYGIVSAGRVELLRELLEHARIPINVDAQWQGDPLLVFAAGLHAAVKIALRIGDRAATVAFLLDRGVSEASRAALRAAQRRKVDELFRDVDRLRTYIHRRGGETGGPDEPADNRYPSWVADPNKYVYGNAINAQNDPGFRGDTLLHLAAKRGRSVVVEALLRIPGIDVARRNNAGRTALDEARRRANASGSMMRDLPRGALAEMDKIIAMLRAREGAASES